MLIIQHVECFRLSEERLEEEKRELFGISSCLNC